MAIKASTGLRNQLMDTGSLKGALDDGFINIYAGTVPATADAAVGAATLLCTISVNSTGTGITFDSAASGGVISKAPGEVWSGVNAATGTAAWYRHVGDSDDGTLATDQPRLQGLVGVSGADLNLSSVSLTSGATQTVDFYSVALPTL
jgi:hypothetical protein